MAQTLDEFKEKFTEEPKREDLSLLWPHSDDPSDQVRLQTACTVTTPPTRWGCRSVHSAQAAG